MRVTDQMMFELSARSASQARTRVAHGMQEVSTGLRVIHPGDDPGVAGLLVQSNVLQDRFEAIGTAAGFADSELTVADTAAQGASNALVRFRELAMQLVNPIYTASQRATAASEAEQIFSQVISHLNTRLGDRYIFAGNRDGTAPFDATGNYLGDTAIRKVEVAPGVLAAASVRADVALKGVDPTTGAQTGVDVLATMQALSAALRANDVVAIRATLDPLDTALSQVSALRGQIGDAQNAMTTAVSTSEAALADERIRASALGDVDVTSAATSLAEAQQALQASLAASAGSLRLTLLDYLR
jgi:flagellar hook-associated protein 3 FlgL